MTDLLSDGELTRGNGATLWRQIAEKLGAEIIAGARRPGERLPTEHQLSQSLGVNRHTVRRAVAALADRGLVRIEQGRGSFVQEAVLDYQVKKRTRFSENLSALQREAGGRLLRESELAAEPAVARALEIRADTPVVLLERLYEADGRPVSITAHYFVKSRLPTIGEAYRAAGSITRALALCGVEDYSRKVTRVTARVARASDCRLLQQAPNRPILMTEGINVDSAGRPIEYCVARWASERVQLIFEPAG